MLFRLVSDGEFFKELEELFFYAQIRRYVRTYVCTSCCVRVMCALCIQGVESTVDREVSCIVLVEQQPDIMRVIGYYPSDEEVRGRPGVLCVISESCVYRWRTW